MKVWHLYLLHCEDGSIYTGIALDPKKRLLVHLAGRGAKYTKSHKPISIIYTEVCGTLSDALKRERQVKKLKRTQKLALSLPKVE